MPDLWQFLDATPAERALFPDLDSALRQAGERAAPPNRLREARRVDAPDGVYFLKIFWRTQWKNRLRFAWTAPRCRLDGEREWLVGRALRERGVETARPVALGVRGGLSCYLCAALPGRSLRDLLARGELSRTVALAAARFAGGVGARGVVLPDLSADHVFVLDAERPRFAVLDLHNGRLGRPGRRDVARILRHCHRSLRGLPVGRRLALGCAVRLLDALGQRRRARALLARLPPLATHARYDEPGRGAAYRRRDPGRHRRELRCLRRVWPGRPGDLVLDVPCGAGRLREVLQGELGARAVGADRSIAMLAQAGGGAPRVLADAAGLPFGDRAFDGVVVFRFLHHLDAPGARHLLREAARVAGRYLVVSFFHPVSAHGVRRRLARLFGGRASTRHAVWPRRLERWLGELGFAPRRRAGELPYLREFWVAAFERVDRR